MGLLREARLRQRLARPLTTDAPNRLPVVLVVVVLRVDVRRIQVHVVRVVVAVHRTRPEVAVATNVVLTAGVDVAREGERRNQYIGTCKAVQPHEPELKNAPHSQRAATE